MQVLYYSILGRQDAPAAQPITDSFWEWNVETGGVKVFTAVDADARSPELGHEAYG
jgi:hypothetical protein